MKEALDRAGSDVSLKDILHLFCGIYHSRSYYIFQTPVNLYPVSALHTQIKRNIAIMLTVDNKLTETLY